MERINGTTNIALNYIKKNIILEYPLQFVYLDETWIFEHGMVQQSWQDNRTEVKKKLKTER